MRERSEWGNTYYHWVPSHGFQRFAPALFVLFWSTGFVVAHYGSEDAGPLTFLTIRTVISALILFGIAKMVKEEPMPMSYVPIQIAVGTGIHAMYLGGVWVAVHHGLPSGISALIAALHPVVTTVFARLLLGEHLSARRIAGVVLGFVGVLAVVVERGGAGDGVTVFALWAMAVAVIGMSAGTLVQRKYGQGTPLLAGTAWQYSATAVVLGIGAIGSEKWQFTITARSMFSMAWSVFVLSLAAILIMLWLLHRQAASQVSSLFFLTPALSTIEGAILFQERLGVWSVLGLVVAVVGVWLATSEPRARPISLQK